MNNYPNNDNIIDFVVLWCDSSDSKWLEEMAFWKEKISGEKVDIDADRYRDWGIFKYWFRAVEKYAPWVRKVHLVTNGQVPDFLDLSNSKIQLVVHKDYMKASSIPTFNSHAIEMQIPYIEDLAEQFVYFNDDIFLVDYVSPEHFFKEGKRVDLFCERSFIRYYDSVFYRIIATNRRVFNEYVNGNKRKYIKKNIGFKKWFSFKLPFNYFISNLFYFIVADKFVGFSIEHGASPFFKSECLEAIGKFEKIYNDTINEKLRGPNQINQYLFRYWSILKGSYVIDKKAGCCFFLINDLKKIYRGFEHGFKYPIICLNDSSHIKDFDDIKDSVISILDKRFPNKCSFEK